MLLHVDGVLLLIRPTCDYEPAREEVSINLWEAFPRIGISVAKLRVVPKSASSTVTTDSQEDTNSSQNICDTLKDISTALSLNLTLILFFLF